MSLITQKVLGLWKRGLPVCAVLGRQAVRGTGRLPTRCGWLLYCGLVAVSLSAESASESTLSPHLTSDTASVKRDL